MRGAFAFRAVMMEISPHTVRSPAMARISPLPVRGRRALLTGRRKHVPGEAFPRKNRETTLTFFPSSDTIISVSARRFARRQRR